MSTDVIMPALGMAQDTGKVLQWRKAPGEPVVKGEPLMEVETDKVTVEIEAPATGVLADVTAAPGDEVPVGRVIAVIRAPDAADDASARAAPAMSGGSGGRGLPAPQDGERSGSAGGGVHTPSPVHVHAADRRDAGAPSGAPSPGPKPTPRVAASPVAARLAAQHEVDLRRVEAAGQRITKDDVLAYLSARPAPVERGTPRIAASPKARRLAGEMGVELARLAGTGPDGAVLTADVLAAAGAAAPGEAHAGAAVPPAPLADGAPPAAASTPSTTWRLMAERTTQSWTAVPHFYLSRAVDATRLAAWRESARRRLEQGAPGPGAGITYTDLLLKLVAAALCAHPRLNAAYADGAISLNDEVNVGLAVAVEEGLIVPVLHGADRLGLRAIAARRHDLVSRAQAGALRPEDVHGGTFTISNLGMYGVDSFNAIINPPQAAILAVGRIAERVVPLDGQPAVRPMLDLTLSCDHRVVDGARGALFLATLAALIDEPLALVE